MSRGTDMLLWWEADDATELAVLYLESFGHPRWFARTARRVGARIPVLTVHAGRSAPGQRAAASHTAAAAAPLITRQALFDQAGIIATTSFGELLDAAVLMASQPVPAGSGVAIVSNGGGAGVLAADACAEAGLAVAAMSARDPQPPAGGAARRASALGGPVDTTAAVGAEAFGEALHIAAAEDGVDAVIAVVVRHALADLVPVLTAARLPVPVAAVVLDQPEAVRLLPGDGTGPDPGPCPRTPTRKRPPGRWPAPPATAPGGPGRPARYRSSADLRVGGRALDRRLLPGADAGRRLAVRRGGRRPAALLRHPDGGVPPGRRRRRGRRGRRPAWAATW